MIWGISRIRRITKIVPLLLALWLLLVTGIAPAAASSRSASLALPPLQQATLPPLQAPWPAGQEWENTPGSNWHKGTDQFAIDFNKPGAGNGDEGTLVLAAVDGVVVAARNDCPKETKDKYKYGCEVVLGHAYGYQTRYAHLTHKQVLVKVGQFVTQGTPLGYLGNTGNSNGAHLHFALYYCTDEARWGQDCSSKDLRGVSPSMLDARSGGPVDANKAALIVSENYGVGYEANTDPRTISTLHSAIVDVYHRYGGQYWVFGQATTPVMQWPGSGVFYQEFGPSTQPGVDWSGLRSAIVESGGQAYFIVGPIWEDYRASDGPQGKWGPPVSDTYEWRLPAADSYRTDFANGSIIWIVGGSRFEYLDDENAPWVGQFFDQPNVFSGASVERRDNYLDFRWQAGDSIGPVIARDGFSAMWKTTESGLIHAYTVVAESQGHLEVYINGNIVLTINSPDQVQQLKSPLQIGALDQQIEVRFWQDGGKNARLFLTTTGIVPAAFGSEGEIVSGSPPVPEIELAQYAPPPFPDDSASSPTPIATGPLGDSSTTTLLVMDTSDSMNEADAGGMTKLQAAQGAAGNILDIIGAEISAQETGSTTVGIVDFNCFARVDLSITSDIAAARSALQGLQAECATGMSDGLQAALDLLSNDSSGGRPIIILLSDGMPNIGLGGDQTLEPDVVKQQVLDLASQAGKQGSCIYTVGFGVPYATGEYTGDASIDEDFLKQVSANAGCGTYYNAQNATELANVYVKLRHTSTGNVLLEKSGQIAQGERVEIGTTDVPANQSQILFTLNWPGSRLDPVLIDPSGKQVDSNYPGASIAASSTLASIIINAPQPGQWKLAAVGADIPEGITTYSAFLSARPNASATMPTSSGGFPFVLLVVLVAGGGVAAYVIARRKTGHTSAVMARLVVASGPLAGQTVVVTASAFVIGRGSSCQLRLVESSVSRRHAQIRCAEGSWYLQDLGSDGGTFVNGQRVSATRLNSGDHITIGGTTLLFEPV